jgi:hypothetical protein
MDSCDSTKQYGTIQYDQHTLYNPVTQCGVTAVPHLLVMDPPGDCHPLVGRGRRRSFGRPAAGTDRSD